MADGDTKRDANSVRAFISYSWDDDEHKRWAFAFAKRLRADGIDAIIDQMHLQPGQYSAQFMERSIKESDRVLIVCTEAYKRRFDNREGGAGYEGHIITGEMLNQLPKAKFIPVLRQGNWDTAAPTALQGLFGVDLRKDSDDEYRKLVESLHGVSSIPPLGPRPAWLVSPTLSTVSPVGHSVSDPTEYWSERKRLPDTPLLATIWSKPHWKIWIRPVEYKPARFQSLGHCQQFMRTSRVQVQDLTYPAPSKGESRGDKWIGGELEESGSMHWSASRWVLFQSAQFIDNRAFEERAQLGDRIHVLEILDTVTAVFEFAVRMADQGVLSTQPVVTFDLLGVAGRALTWPKDIYTDLVGDSWCQDDHVQIEWRGNIEQLKAQTLELAFQHAIGMYAKFRAKLPLDELWNAQKRRLR